VKALRSPGKGRRDDLSYKTNPGGSSGAPGGFAAAALGAYGIDRGVANQLSRHQARYEELAAVIVELDSGAFGIGFSDNPETVLLVLDLLSSGKNLHVASLEPFASSRTLFPANLLSFAEDAGS